jgi:hypothetical protein
MDVRVDPAWGDCEAGQVDSRFLLRVGDASNAATLDYDFLVPKHMASAIDQRGGLEDNRLSGGENRKERKHNAYPERGFPVDLAYRMQQRCL